MVRAFEGKVVLRWSGKKEMFRAEEARDAPEAIPNRGGTNNQGD